MPTQIGSTEFPLTSLRMTMGMLVTGSSIRPRIFISTSMEFPLGPADRPGPGLGAMSLTRLQIRCFLKLEPVVRPHTGQAVGAPCGNANLPREPNPVSFSGKVNHPVARRTSDRLAEAGLKPFDQHLELAPDQSLVPSRLDRALPLLELGQSRSLLLLRDRVRPAASRSVRARGVLKREDLVVLGLLQQRQRLLEVFPCLAAKTDDDVRRYANITLRITDAIYFFKVLFSRIASKHAGKHPARPRLYGEMDMVAQRRVGFDGLYDIRSKVPRMGGSEAHPVDSSHIGRPGEQLRKAQPGRRGVTVRIDILAKELDLPVAVVHEPPAFLQDVAAR